MAYQVSWYQEGRIAQYVYSGDLTVNDLAAANIVFLQWLESSNDTIHVIVDVSKINSSDFTLKDLMKIEVLGKVVAHPKIGWVVYYDRHNPFHTFMNSVLHQSHEQKVKFVDSQAEAVHFLQQMDDSLLDSK